MAEQVSKKPAPITPEALPKVSTKVRKSKNERHHHHHRKGDEDEEEVEALPKMSQQTLKNTTPAGFGEIFNTTTQPIYSKMDLKKLVHPTGAEPEIPALNVSSSKLEEQHDKLEQFERIYGKIKAQEEGGKRSVTAHAGGEATAAAERLKNSLQASLIKTIVKTTQYRMVLAGSHKEDEDLLADWMKDVVEDVNVHSYSETLNGVFIMYPHHFIHVLEGSEDVLMKYMKLIAEQFEPTGYDWNLEYTPGKGVTVKTPIMFTTVKVMVIGMFQLKHRGLTNGWKVERTGPGLTMTKEEVPPGDYRERLFRFTRQCIIMALVVHKLPPLRYTGAESQTGMSAFDMTDTFNVATEQSEAEHDVDEDDERFQLQEQRRKRLKSLAQIVPKPPMIDYIMRKNPKRKIQLRTVREHIDYFWKIPTLIFSQQTDWPIISKIAPYD